MAFLRILPYYSVLFLYYGSELKDIVLFDINGILAKLSYILSLALSILYAVQETRPSSRPKNFSGICFVTLILFYILYITFHNIGGPLPPWFNPFLLSVTPILILIYAGWNDLASFKSAILAGSSLLIIFGLFMKFQNIDESNVLAGRDSILNINPNHLAMMLGFPWILCFLKFIKRNTGIVNIIHFSILSTLIFLTGSRSFLAAFIIFLFLLFLSPKVSNIQKIYFLIFAFFVTGLFLSINSDALLRVYTDTGDFDLSGRDLIIRDFLSNLEFRFFGYPYSYISGAFESAGYPDNTSFHNVFLETFFNAGVFGLVMLILLLAIVLYKILILKNLFDICVPLFIYSIVVVQLLSHQLFDTAYIWLMIFYIVILTSHSGHDQSSCIHR